jgi:hypothetical protein
MRDDIPVAPQAIAWDWSVMQIAYAGGKCKKLGCLEVFGRLLQQA